jgi:hypothetical protein
VGSTLLTIDPVTAVATSIGQELTGRDMRGAAYSNGVIYALDSQNNALLQVNPATGVPTSVLQLTMAGSPYLLTNATDLAFDPTGAVYVVEGDRDGIVDQTFLGTRFFSLDTATGVLTLVGTDTAGGLRVGMGAAFADGFLFVNEMNDGDDIYQYSGAGFGTRATVFLNPIADNSGRGDLANVVADVVIPEPATFGLIGTALLALAALRRRRA